MDRFQFNSSTVAQCQARDNLASFCVTVASYRLVTTQLRFGAGVSLLIENVASFSGNFIRCYGKLIFSDITGVSRK